MYRQAGISFLGIAATDEPNFLLLPLFESASKYMDEAIESGGKVLVHCVAGVSRSATITIAYIMQRSLLSMMDAFKLVKRQRHIVAPNFNFMGQLMELERRLQDGSAPRDLTFNLGIDADRQKCVS